MQTYLSLTKHNTYKYQRRVPKTLKSYISTSYFRISLGTDIANATLKAINYNTLIDDSIKLVSLNVTDDTILKKLKELLPTEKKVRKQRSKSHLEGLFLDITSNYLEAKKNNVSDTDFEGSIYFYTKVCPALFTKILYNSNPKLSDITYNNLLDFKDILTKLPKRNIQKYKVIELDDILKDLDNIPKEVRLSANSVNKYIQRLRAIFEFALNLGLITHNLAKALKLQEIENDKLQRLPLSIKETSIISTYLSVEKDYLMQVLRYTGLRLSELYKCKVETIDSILCFTLLDRSIKLKTKSSYRVIPIHNKLIANINMLDTYRTSITSDNLAKSISKIIKKQSFKDANKKSLYSLRHTFASELIVKGANNMIVSQLLGHSLSSTGGMTMNRYSSGYSTNQLKEIVELLI